MANPVGSGAAIMMPLTSRNEGFAREYSGGGYEADLSSIREPAPERPLHVEPEIRALLGRIVVAVHGQEEGLTAVELRAQLKERPELLQRALATGLRERRIRRTGSRCQTRYILNG
jgi:hypothetical protein